MSIYMKFMSIVMKKKLKEHLLTNALHDVYPESFPTLISAYMYVKDKSVFLVDPDKEELLHSIDIKYVPKDNDELAVFAGFFGIAGRCTYEEGKLIKHD